MLVTLLVLAGAGLVAGLYFAFRPSSDTAPATAPTTPTETEVEPATTDETTTEETTTEETTTAEETKELRVTVRDAKPVGGIQHLTVRQGDEVKVRVESDVADEIHVHGYDLMVDVATGAEAEIEFRATIVGRFEIELEQHGTPIAELEVRP